MAHSNPTSKPSPQFLRGLKEYNLTYEQLLQEGWKYAGGSNDRHLKYFNISSPEGETLPPFAAECVCGHRIKENCYITNDSEILILGNCCIKRFIPKSGRTCEKCGEPHKNRIVNRCNDCRVGICDGCGCSLRNPQYPKCWSCAHTSS